MAASGGTPILLYGSTTSGNTPSSSNLTTSSNGVELAVNAADGKLFYKDTGGTVQVLATKGAGTVPGSNTQVIYNNSGALGASSNLTFDGTNLTLGGGTANGVAYLNGSKVLTTGSALTFDGSNLTATSTGNATLTVNSTAGAYTSILKLQAAGGGGSVINATGASSDLLAFQITSTEQMRLTSTGLGIGTSSPGAKLDVVGSGSFTGTTNFVKLSVFNTGGETTIARDDSTGSQFGTAYATNIFANGAYPMQFWTNGTKQATIDSSGNLGLGVTPSAWGSSYKAIQFATTGALHGVVSSTYIGLESNAYLNSSGIYKYIASDYASNYTQGAGQHIWNVASSGTAGGTISFIQAMTLSNGGNLTISPTTPNSGSPGLYVNLNYGNTGDTSTAIRFNLNGGAGGGYLTGYSGNASFTQNYEYISGTGNVARGTTASGIQLGNGAIAFFTNTGLTSGSGFTPSQTMTLNSSGYLGIGTTSPSYVLDVNGAINTSSDLIFTGVGVVRQASQSAYTRIVGGTTANTDPTITLYGSTNGNAGLITYDGSSHRFRSASAGVEYMRLDTNGNLGLGVTPSAWGSSGNMQLPTLTFAGQDYSIGSNYYQNSGYKYVAASSTPAAKLSFYNGQFLFYNAPSGTAGNAISFTQAMTLDTSGNLGIGTTSPSSALYVKRTSGNSGIYTDYNGTNVGRIEAASNGNLYIGLATGSGVVGLGVTSNANAVVIDSSGNLLVGTTSSTAFQNANCFVIRASSGDAIMNHASGTSSGADYFSFGYNAGSIGSITQNGTTGVLYNTSSDQRLKTNIVDAPEGNVDAIKVRSFDWIADGSHQTYGMVAQELLEVAPYAVSKPEDPEEMMGVDYSKLVPMLIKEIQSLRARVAQLETKGS